MITLKKKEDQLAEFHDKVSKRVGTMQAVFNGPILKLYVKAQVKRWATEGASEGSRWPALNAEYKKQKQKRFAAFPGGGRKMMVATSRLYMAATNQGKGFNKIATNSRLTVAIDTGVIPYASQAAEERPFMGFSDETIKQMKSVIQKYIKEGVLG